MNASLYNKQQQSSVKNIKCGHFRLLCLCSNRNQLFKTEKCVNTLNIAVKPVLITDMVSVNYSDYFFLFKKELLITATHYKISIK